MNILHVITTIRRGGAENHLFELIKLQVNNDYRVSVAYLKEEGYWKKSYEDMGVKVLALDIRSKFSYLYNKKIKTFIKETNPDIVHAHMGPAELLTRFGLLFSNIPLVITKHCDVRFAPMPFENIAMKWVARRASKIITISNSVKEYFHNKGISPLKTRTIYYGVSPESISSVKEKPLEYLKKEFGIKKSTIVFGTLSRLVPQKSLDTMILGFNLFLQQANSSDFLLIIVGRGKKKHDLVKLQELVEKHNLQDKVLFTGFRADAYELLSIFHVFLLTSTYEGLGLALLEAMSASKPIIATNVSAIPEIIGNAGILIPPKSPVDLAQAMNKLLIPQLRKSYGSIGYKRVKEKFTLQKMYIQTNSLYMDVISNGSSVTTC